MFGTFLMGLLVFSGGMAFFFWRARPQKPKGLVRERERLVTHLQHETKEKV